MKDVNKWYTFIIFTLCIYLIIVPFVIYCIYKFNQRKDDIIIQKRYPSITLIFGVIIIKCDDTTSIISTHTICDDPQNFTLDCDISNEFVLKTMHYSLLFSVYTISTVDLWIILLRYWLIFYNVNWTRSTTNQTWKIHLNPSNAESDWYLSHKSTFGNIKYCGKRLFILYLIVVILVFMLKFFIWTDDGAEINMIVGIFFTVIPVCILLIFACKIRKFKDGFYIIKEIKWITLIVMSGLICYPFFGVMVPSIFGVNLFIRSVFVTTVNLIQSVIYLYIQTLYILKMVTKDETLNFMSKSDDEMNLASMIEMQERKKRNPNKDQEDVKLEDTLKDAELFQRFMQHLANEWSMELLLAFIELTQLQSAIKHEFGKSNEYEMVFIPSQIAILENDDIPQSCFVYQNETAGFIRYNDIDFANNKLMEYKVKSCIMYLKYVNSGAELEINIS